MLHTLCQDTLSLPQFRCPLHDLCLQFCVSMKKPKYLSWAEELYFSWSVCLIPSMRYLCSKLVCYIGVVMLNIGWVSLWRRSRQSSPVQSLVSLNISGSHTRCPFGQMVGLWHRRLKFKSSLLHQGSLLFNLHYSSHSLHYSLCLPFTISHILSPIYKEPLELLLVRLR